MDEEILSGGIDKLIDHLNTLPRASIHILNSRRWLQFQAAYKALREAVSQTDATLSCEFRPGMGNAVIHLRSDSLLWERGQTFPKELLLASNLEIYPLVDSMLQMDVMFYGVTTAVRESDYS